MFYFCIIKCQSRTVLSSVLLFLCVTCDLTCDLWLVTCTLAPPENHMIWKTLQVPRNPRSPCNAMHVRNTMPWSKEKCPWRVLSSFDPRTYKRKFISPLWYWWNPSLELLICCSTSKRFERNNFTAHNCHGKTKNLTAKPKTSRQKQKPHGKTKNLTAKSKYLTTKPKTSRKNQRPHGKKYFVFAVRFLVLPWQLWATIQLYSKEWSHAIARTARGDPSDNNNTRLFSLLSVNKFKSFVLNSL